MVHGEQLLADFQHIKPNSNHIVCAFLHVFSSHEGPGIQPELR